MITRSSHGRRKPSRGPMGLTACRGFTLVELVIAITVAAILVGISVPSIRGLQKQQAARQPVAELVGMARTVRGRAMAEQRPYQVVFDREGFHAAEYFSPYGGKEEFSELLNELEEAERKREMVEASKERVGNLEEAGIPGQVMIPLPGSEEREIYYESFQLPEGIRYSILMRGDQQWVDMDGGDFKRWVFQPSGMCDPFKIRIQSDNAFFEVSFHPLTGDIVEEKSYVE